ncbi:MAG: EutN/CcmL family microcompartment protein [Paludibaculum sp.]
MLIARVIGDITATQKHLSHEGKKLLLVQPLDLDGTNRGMPVIAVDSVSAGIGDRVLLVQDGFAAFTTVGLKIAPIDSAVIGVIDHVQLVSDLDAVPSQPAPTAAEPRPAAKKQGKKQRPQ